MILKHDQAQCCGCKLCVLGCSYHRTGAFNPDESFIEVERDFETSRVSWKLDSACDGCRDEAVPVCVVFCPYGDLTVEAE